MLPKPKALSTAQIKALLGRDSDSEDNCDEIFGPGVELDDEDLPSTSSGAQGSAAAGAQASGDADVEGNPDNYDNHVESK